MRSWRRFEDISVRTGISVVFTVSAYGSSMIMPCLLIASLQSPNMIPEVNENDRSDSRPSSGDGPLTSEPPLEVEELIHFNFEREV